MNVFAVAVATLATIGIARAEDVAVFVLRGRRAIQTSDQAPVSPANDTAYFFRAEATGLNVFEPVQDAQIKGPNNQTTVLTKTSEGSYVFEKGFTAEAPEQTAFPSGKYLFSAKLNFLGPTSSHADLNASSYPPFPTLQSFATTQSIDATSEFTLHWNAFSDAVSEDQLALRITDPSTGTVLVDEPSIDPSTTEWTLSGDTLPGEKSLAGQLIFRRFVAASQLEFGELLPCTTYYVSETRFTLATHGATTPVDNTPPTLVSTTPVNGSVLATAFDPIQFRFSEPMNASKGTVVFEASLHDQPIVIDPTKVIQIWTDDHLELGCIYNQAGGWPAGATLVWHLNAAPAGANRFEDVAGNPLASASGQYTAAGGVDPCSSESPGAVPGSSFAFFKQVNYLQETVDAALPDSTQGAQAFSFISLPASTPVQTIVTLKVPTDDPHAFHLKVLSPPVGGTGLSFRLFSESFAARSELDTAYPAGTYQFELRNAQAQSTNSIPLTVSATGYPPIPHISNFAACQQLQANSDFTIQWDAFAGATTNKEFLGFQIEDPDGNTVFQAPDACHQISLDPSATGVRIPSGTLVNGKQYTGVLTFTRMSDSGKILPSVPGTGIAALARIVRFPIRTGILAPPSAPVFEQITAVGDGTIEVRIACTPGRALVVERAGTPNGPFAAALNTNSPTAKITLRLPTTEAHGFFRAVHP